MTRTSCGLVPPSPPNANINSNMDEAAKRWNPLWFRDQVRNKGPWDYKQQGPLYEDFGNFNYGAAGTAMGFPQVVLLREAGAASQAADPQNRQNMPGDPGHKWNPFSWVPPYKDDPADQAQIMSRVAFEKCVNAGRY